MDRCDLIMLFMIVIRSYKNASLDPLKWEPWVNNTDKIIMGAYIIFFILFIGGNLYEFFGAKKIVKSLYFLGIKLVSFKEEWGDVRFCTNGELNETPSGKFKFLNSSTVLFRCNQPLLSFRVNTPFSLKGVIELRSGVAYVSARTPLIPSIFFSIWLMGWTMGGIAITIFGGQDLLLIMTILIGGYIFVGAIIGFSYILEKKRLLTVYEEIKVFLKIQSNSISITKNKKKFPFEWKYNAIFLCMSFLLFYGTYTLFLRNALSKITETKPQQNLRLSDFEAAFKFGKHQEEKEKLKSEWSLQCDTKKDYSCRFLGYLKELENDEKGALAFYVKSCSILDPHSCYNIISNSHYANAAEIEKSKSILEPLCSGTERNNFKSCCECYEEEKKKGKL